MISITILGSVLLENLVKTWKISNKKLIDSAKEAAFYDWNLMVLKEKGIMSWDKARRIMDENTRKGLKRP